MKEGERKVSFTCLRHMIFPLILDFITPFLNLPHCGGIGMRCREAQEPSHEGERNVTIKK